MTRAIDDLALRSRPGEQWLDIPGHGGLFQVSSHGRVKRLAHINCRGVACQEGIVKQYVQRGQYAYVNMMYNGRQDVAAVAGLVARAFFGEAKQTVHVNGDTLDNTVTNLVCRGNVVTRNTATRCRPVAMHDLSGNRLALFGNGQRRKAIINCCHGRQIMAFGYRWAFADE